MKTCCTYIGVDVSKENLDVFVPAEDNAAKGELKQLPNEIKGFRALRTMARKRKAIVCFEPTGGYELELISFMHRYGVSVAYTEAFRVRRFAEAEGTFAKNDHIDAKLISRFAQKMGVKLIEEKEMSTIELKRRAKLRQQFIDMRTMMIARQETEQDMTVRKMLRDEARRFSKLIAQLEKECAKVVAADERMKELDRRFQLVGGMGSTTSSVVLSSLPEIGKLPDEKLFMLVGIAPIEKQSGKQEWQRRIWGGRKDVRNALYMAATSCIIWNSRLSAYYRKKRAEGHPHKWCMVPMMRKLLSLLNRIARDPSFVPTPEPKEFREAQVKQLKVGRKCRVS